MLKAAERRGGRGAVPTPGRNVTLGGPTAWRAKAEAAATNDRRPRGGQEEAKRRRSGAATPEQRPSGGRQSGCRTTPERPAIGQSRCQNNEACSKLRTPGARARAHFRATPALRHANQACGQGRNERHAIHRHVCGRKPRKSVASREAAAVLDTLLASAPVEPAPFTGWCFALARGPPEPLHEVGGPPPQRVPHAV